MTDEQKPKTRARKRAIRARMEQTGEPFSVAARHVAAKHDRKTAERSAAESPAQRGRARDDHSVSQEAEVNNALAPAKHAGRHDVSNAYRPHVGVEEAHRVQLTVEEARSVLRAAERESPCTHALISVLLTGGLRLQEAHTARAEHLGVAPAASRVWSF
ncbi:hypothetical protein [Actinacidiphila oryziradicis]|uniref:Uncharacterized protein n=1 Tax=Actinacidiphila oryziradicis TaxID=2571141 RepID=A0A4U0RZ49_9ACTN|nr:hypothetical protein [Actinacidiphila oryziradicis]TKA01686.1 hypothetical protein FCI23_40045 [Actinacidiphila oryziradicis]